MRVQASQCRVSTRVKSFELRVPGAFTKSSVPVLMAIDKYQCYIVLQPEQKVIAELLN